VSHFYIILHFAAFIAVQLHTNLRIFCPQFIVGWCGKNHLDF